MSRCVTFWILFCDKIDGNSCTQKYNSRIYSRNISMLNYCGFHCPTKKKNRRSSIITQLEGNKDRNDYLGFFVKWSNCQTFRSTLMSIEVFAIMCVRFYIANTDNVRMMNIMLSTLMICVRVDSCFNSNRQKMCSFQKQWIYCAIVYAWMVSLLFLHLAIGCSSIKCRLIKQNLTRN